MLPSSRVPPRLCFRPVVFVRIRQPAFSASRVWLPCLHGRRLRSTLPPLFQQQDDGSEKPIVEQDLYGFSRFRWLCDDKEYLQQRHREFNVAALVKAAVRAAGDGATSCTKLVKAVESHSNKILFLTMNNGQELVAKIPNPLAGPAYFTVASEVATSHFLRSVLRLPVPKIHSFSPDSRNSVQAEYIIGEKPIGVPVGALWQDWRRKDIVDFVDKFLIFQRKLSSVSFAGHGCIYLKKHLEQKNARIEDLGLKIEAEVDNGDESVAAPDVNLQASSIYALGPVVDPTFWESERSSMDLNRGPWKTSLGYMKALGVDELQWAKSYAKPRADPLCGSIKSQTPIHYIQLLEKYLKFVPHLCPQPSHRPTLSHANLSSFNVLVDPETRDITCVTNWQSAQVLPPLFQPSIPLLFHESSNAAGGRGAFAAQTYFQLLEKKYPQRYESLLLPPDREGMIKLSEILPGAWTHKRNKLLGVMLMNMVHQWEGVIRTRRAELDEAGNKAESASNTTGNESREKPIPPCPITFSQEEVEQNEAYIGRFEQLMETLDGYGLPHPASGGMVLADDFDDAVKTNAQAKKTFLSSANNEDESRVFDKIWPFPVTDVVDNQPQHKDMDSNAKESWWKVW